MAFFLTDAIFGGIMKGGWSGLKNTGRAARGTHIKKDKATGLDVSVSPFRDGLLGDIKKHGKEMITGEGVAGKVGGAVDVASDLTFGAAGQALGWAVGGAAKVTAGAGLWAAPKIGRQVGRSTKEAFDLFGDTAINAASVVNNMTKTRTGQMALFAGGGLAVAATGAAGEVFPSHALDEGLQSYVGKNLDSVAGTVDDYTGSGSQRSVDNMNADGDLVFALHNLR